MEPLVVDAALAAARVGLLSMRTPLSGCRCASMSSKPSRSEFLTTFERERRRLKIQLSSGPREPLVGPAALLAEASAELAHGDEGAARRLLMAARARPAGYSWRRGRGSLWRTPTFASWLGARTRMSSASPVWPWRCALSPRRRRDGCGWSYHRPSRRGVAAASSRPPPTSSSRRCRLNRGGNRLTNTALHMIAVTQSRTEGAGRAYLEKAQARGKTRTEAIRLLRRRISDAVFAALRADAELIKLTVPRRTTRCRLRLDIGASRSSTARRHAREVHRRASSRPGAGSCGS